MVFDSIHHVLAAEKAWLGEGLWCDLVPLPRSLTADCGMALECGAADEAAWRPLLGGRRWRALYRREAGGFRELEACGV